MLSEELLKKLNTMLEYLKILLEKQKNGEVQYSLVHSVTGDFNDCFLKKWSKFLDILKGLKY